MSKDNKKIKTFVNREEDYAIVWTDDGLIDIDEFQEFIQLDRDGDRSVDDYADYDLVDCDV